jgi:hypothetical protein
MLDELQQRAGRKSGCESAYSLNLTHELTLPHVHLFLTAVLFRTRADTFQVER